MKTFNTITQILKLNNNNMKNKVLFLATMAILGVASLKAQLNVGSTSAPDPSAVLQATSTTQGFLMPRMTSANINAIVGAVEGLMVYCTNCSPVGMRVYISGTWTDIGAMAVVSAPQNTIPSSISGKAVVGGGAQTITAVLGTWVGTSPIAYTYQWQVSTDNGATFNNISGGTGGNYTIGGSAAVSSNSFRVVITGVNNIGTTVVNSPTIFVASASAVPNAGAPPVISGTSYIDSSVNTSNGTWTANANGLSYTYQWASGGVAIAGAVKSTYKITYLEEGTAMTCVVTAKNGFGTANATSTAYHNWTPKDVSTTQLQLWLDGGDDRTISLAGGALSAWTDKSGKGFNFAQPTASLRPTVVNHRVTFDGVGTFLTNTNWPATSFSAGTTFAYNATMNASGSYVRIFDFGVQFNSDNLARYNVMVFRQTSNYTYVVAASTSPNPYVNSESSPPNTTDGVNGSYSMVTNAAPFPSTASGVFYKDGLPGTTNSAMYNPNNVARFSNFLGKSNWAQDAGFLSGNISEMVMYSTAFSATDRQKLEGYLAWKWGTVAYLPVGHAYKTSAPLP